MFHARYNLQVASHATATQVGTNDIIYFAIANLTPAIVKFGSIETLNLDHEVIS